MGDAPEQQAVCRHCGLVESRHGPAWTFTLGEGGRVQEWRKVRTCFTGAPGTQFEPASTFGENNDD